MNVERLRRRLVRKVALCRLFGNILVSIAGIVHALARVIEDLAESVFLIESDAANRYEDLTGIDLGKVIGHEERYYRGALGEAFTYSDDGDD